MTEMFPHSWGLESSAEGRCSTRASIQSNGRAHTEGREGLTQSTGQGNGILYQPNESLGEEGGKVFQAEGTVHAEPRKREKAWQD